MSRAKAFIKRSIVAVAASLLMVGGSVLAFRAPLAADVGINGPYNCDSNAVMYCGAASASAVATKYNDGDGLNSAVSIQNIYSWFGITSNDVQSLASTAVVGDVTSNGDVYVNNVMVANNALTGGRDNIPGSSAESYNGTSFYTRPPSISFLSSPLAAYVVMSNNQFQFAILASCGNAVKAVPTTTPPKPAPTPTPTPTPSPTPTPTIPPATTTSTPASLPNTGASFIQTIAIFIAVSAGGYVVFRLYLKRRVKRDY